jgi:hypothetical protein
LLPPLLMELPSYRWPSPRNLALGLYERAVIFLKRVGGIILAGIVITRLGLLRSLILGSVLVMFSNFGFSLLARADAPSLVQLGLVNGFDNLAQAIHGTSLIAFLSSLTSARYTATQYALFSSLYALPPKILEGFSGFAADALGYGNFFIYTASLSIPALLVLIYLVRRGLVVARAVAAAAVAAGRAPAGAPGPHWRLASSTAARNTSRERSPVISGVMMATLSIDVW